MRFLDRFQSKGKVGVHAKENVQKALRNYQVWFLIGQLPEFTEISYVRSSITALIIGRKLASGCFAKTSTPLSSLYYNPIVLFQQPWLEI